MKKTETKKTETKKPTVGTKKPFWDGDDEFSFNISEEEFNKRHKKARKDAEPSGKKKKKDKSFSKIQ